MERTDYLDFPGPLGPMRMAERAGRLIGVWFHAQRHYPVADGIQGWRQADTSLLRHTAAQLSAYFEGGDVAFELPLAPHGTDFQRAVWRILETIPDGETLSYGEVARRLGAPAAVRAVGAAVGRNPLAIVVPCHRVVGAKGALTGYAAGIERKAWLLDLERRRRSVRACVPPGTS